MKAIGLIFVAVAVITAIYGLQMMYDNSYSAKIVGGDAYNYIIHATRGTAWVCAGILSSVLALCCFVASLPPKSYNTDT